MRGPSVPSHLCPENAPPAGTAPRQVSFMASAKSQLCSITLPDKSPPFIRLLPSEL